MSDGLGRSIIAALGTAAIVAGVLFLLGVRHLETRTETVIVGIGAILNGALVVRFALRAGKRAA